MNELNVVKIKIHTTNGYDNVDIELNVADDDNTAGTITYYAEVCKKAVQNMTEYVNMDNEQPVQQTIKEGNASPKQRSILLKNGYTEAQIDAMGQKEAAEAVKTIFESKM